MRRGGGRLDAGKCESVSGRKVFRVGCGVGSVDVCV